MADAVKDKTGKSSQKRVEPLRSQETAAGLNARAMPESLAAEAAVLGSMVIDPVCTGQVVEILSRDSFYRIEHQLIYDAIVALYEKNRGEGIDGVLLRDELERRKQLEQAGGVEYLGKVLNSVPSSANVGYYANIVKDKQLLRELITTATDILNDAYDVTGESVQKLDEAEQKIFAITDKRTTGQAFAIKDLVTHAYELIEKRDGKHVTGLATGFTMLDQLTCGLQNGELIIIAGRPSMGKTAIALNIAENLGVNEKTPVGVFSLEMGQQQLAERFLCSVSQVESQLVRKGMLLTEHYTKLVDACGLLSAAPIYIDDTSTLTPLELRAKARRLKSQHDIRCIFVDYLQLMHLGGRVESRQQEITTISRYLKALARELNIPVVVLSQLNRSPEGREDHLPRMSDLRESGSIEQDADVVMLLHREDYYHSGDKEYEQNHLAKLIIAKQRNGPTGTVNLTFLDKFTRFGNASFAGEGFDPAQGGPSTSLQQMGSEEAPF
ncbi:MAG: replicative DNA helicase [Sedimentisphaerales bacterium]|nr:replicative DNA helicase [Sedimentisphaerales bacterium]